MPKVYVQRLHPWKIDHKVWVAGCLVGWWIESQLLVFIIQPQERRDGPMARDRWIGGRIDGQGVMDRGNNEVRMHYVDREWKSEIEARESE